MKKIADEIYLVLQKNKILKETPMETLYLLLAMDQLGREYRLNSKLLCSYFNIKTTENNELIFNVALNYFSITVLLFYIKNIKIYENIKEALKKHILDKFNVSEKENWKSNTELTLLILDITTCPFLNGKVYPKKIQQYKEAKNEKDKLKYKNEIERDKYKYKKQLLTLFGITSNHVNFIEQQEYWFIKWNNFDFFMELQAKKSQEVY